MIHDLDELTSTFQTINTFAAHTQIPGSSKKSILAETVVW